MRETGIHWKKNVALFLTAQSITLFGSMLVQYAIQWHITLTDRSGVSMMLLAISAAVPMCFVSPFAGVWADRYNKKLLINLADAAIAAITLTMAVLFSLGLESIGLLLICLAARGFGQGIQTPAVNSLIPELVPEENLIRVNGVNGSIQSAVMLCAPVAGAALIAFFQVQAVLFIDVFTAIIGIGLMILFVKTSKKQKKPEEKTTWHDMAEGLQYIRRHAVVKKFLLIVVLFNLLFTPAGILTPLQTVRDFGGEKWRLAAVEVAFFIGMSLGGALMGMWGGLKNKSYTIAVSMAVAGLSIAGLGLLDHFMLYLVCIGLTGFFMSVFTAPAMTILQLKVDAAYMGRVFSVMTMLSSIMMPAGMLVWGPLADAVSIDRLLLVSGAGILATGACVILSKTLRDAGAP